MLMPENQRIIITFPHQWSTILLTKFVHQSDNFSNILQIRPPFSNHTCYKQHIVQSSVAEEPLCSFIKLSQTLSNISLNANVNLSVVFRHSLQSVSQSATEESSRPEWRTSTACCSLRPVLAPPATCRTSPSSRTPSWWLSSPTSGWRVSSTS